MREILFRGKRVDSIFRDEWIGGSLWNNYGEVKILSAFNAIGYDVIPETIGQYTGLTDKNGRKIFEGDIVRYTRKTMYCPEASFHRKDLVSLHIIYWSDEYYAFQQKHYSLESKRVIGGGGITFNDDRAKENIIEVIGNIHDNPELLKGGEG